MATYCKLLGKWRACNDGRVLRRAGARKRSGSDHHVAPDRPQRLAGKALLSKSERENGDPGTPEKCEAAVMGKSVAIR